MKRLGLLCRERMVDEVKEGYSDSKACFFIGFNKLDAFSLNLLRNDLGKMNARILLSKNTIIKKALAGIGKDDVDDFLNGSTSLVFIYDDDIVAPCKKLVDFSKEKEGALIFKGGYLQEKRIGEEDIIALSKMPSRKVLLGMAVAALASPLTGFLGALKQIPQRFLWVVEEIKKKKSE